AGSQGSRFGTEAGCSEADRLVTQFLCFYQFIRTEIAFRPDQYDCRFTGPEQVGQIPLFPTHTMSNEPLTLLLSFDKLMKGHGGIYAGQVRLQRLLHRCNGYFYQSLGLDIPTLRTGTDQWGYFIDPRFRRFLDKP